jgi:HD-like signal output (HDOD) protein
MAPTVSRKTVLATLKKPDRLPTLPSVYMALREAAENPRATFKDLTDAIAKDPVTAARILRVANSPYYALREPSEDLSTAVAYLGFIEVQRIALSVGAFQLFSIPRQKHDFLRELWLHSLITAMIGRQLAEWANTPNPEHAYLGGLLHDIGKVFFASAFTREYILVKHEIVNQGCDVLAVEATHLGVTHLEAADFIVRHWEMPPQVAAMIKFHHDPMALAAANRAFPLCVGAANLLSHLVLKDENTNQYTEQLRLFLDELAKDSIPAEQVEMQALLTMAGEILAKAQDFDRAMQ